MTRVDTEWPERRSERLYIRIEPHTKDQIEEAAKETGMTVSEFVIKAVRGRARDVLARRTNLLSENSDEIVAGIDQSQLEVLDRLAAEEGVSRAAVVQRLLHRAMSGNDDDLEADLAAIDASFGAYKDVEVVARDAGERAEHLARIWQTAP